MAAKIRIVLFLLDAPLLLLLVTGGHVTGRALPFSAGFRAFQNDMFLRHDFKIR